MNASFRLRHFYSSSSFVRMTLDGDVIAMALDCFGRFFPLINIIFTLKTFICVFEVVSRKGEGRIHS